MDKWMDEPFQNIFKDPIGILHEQNGNFKFFLNVKYLGNIAVK